MRLTSKLEDNWYCVDFVKSEEETYKNAINKLGQLEDIEEELGIDLVTLFKALNGFIWFVFRYGKERFILKGKPYNFTKKQFTVIDVNEAGMPAQYIMSYTDCLFKDYGKTWSLTKEELL